MPRPYNALVKSRAVSHQVLLRRLVTSRGSTLHFLEDLFADQIVLWSRIKALEAKDVEGHPANKDV
jgi:hypothetical protein